MRFFTKIITMILLTSVMSGCKTTQGDQSQQDNSQNEANNESSFDDQSGVRPITEIAKINAELGMAYLEQKNVQRSKQKLLLALQQGPTIPETWYSMAYFLEATGNKEEAGKYYLKSIEVAPDRGDAQNNYGTFLCRSGRYQESIKHFMLAAKTNSYLDPAAAYENAGLCSMKMQAYSQAAAYFNQALLKDPARTFSLLKLAEVDMKLKKYKEAKEMLTQYSYVASPSSEYTRLSKQLEKDTVNQTG